jgi:hypothetical protein
VENPLTRLAIAVSTAALCTLAACGASSVSGPGDVAGTYRFESPPVAAVVLPGVPQLVQGLLILRADGTAVRRFEYDRALPDVRASAIEERGTFTVRRDSIRFVLRTVGSQQDYAWRVSAARQGSTLLLRYPSLSSNSFTIETYRRD